MKQNSIILILIIFVLHGINEKTYGQRFFKKPQMKKQADFNYVPKKPGHYTVEDWQAVIDATWGEGLPTEKKREIFDQAWNKIDAEFAAFQGLDVDWDALGNFYRNQIDSTTSRGRFSAIMNYMFLKLQEYHALIADLPVMLTPLEPGVPLLFLGGNADNTSHFGATLTPLPDSSLLVLKTVSNHPIGLVPGDIVLGYDNVLWKDWIRELMAYQLPVYIGYSVAGGDQKSHWHNLLCGAGMNWHLFDSLNVVKYSTGDTMSYATSLLAGQNEFIWGNEQLPVPGIDWVYDGSSNVASYVDFGNGLSWGIIEDTNIGYIYVLHWLKSDDNVSSQFYTAINELMNVDKVDGLIIDQRLNYGGRFEWQKGLSLLFNHTFKPFDFRRRCNPEDHYEMCEFDLWDQFLTTNGDPNTFFDRPIAVLTGPAAVSAGDMFPWTMSFQPMVRSFGKPTNGSFSTITQGYNLGDNQDWLMFHTNSNSYSLEDPGNYLSHKAFVPDEEVWFTQEDVVKGEDTVVKRAMEWIRNLAHAHDVTVDKSYIQSDNESVLITATVENPNQHDLSLMAEINHQEVVFTDSLYLYDDGQHGDGDAGDNLWGNSYLPLEEETYLISLTALNNSEQTSRTLPNIAGFTTIGPIEVADTSISVMSETFYSIMINLKNKDLNKTAKNVSIRVSSNDTINIKSINVVDLNKVIDIEPGQTVLAPQSVGIYAQNPHTRIPLTVEIYSNGYHFWTDFTDIPTGIAEEDQVIPKAFSLSQNYPNPFNPSTSIEFALPKTEFVSLKIYNILGEEVTTLVQDKLQAGNHTYQFDASNLASGVYLYRIEAGDYQNVKKMILLR